MLDRGENSGLLNVVPDVTNLIVCCVLIGVCRPFCGTACNARASRRARPGQCRYYWYQYATTLVGVPAWAPERHCIALPPEFRVRDLCSSSCTNAVSSTEMCHNCKH